MQNRQGDCGPNQLRALKKALDSIETEGCKSDELWTDASGNTYTSTVMRFSLCGNYAPTEHQRAASAHLEAIGARHNFTVTRKNCKAIIAECAQAVEALKLQRACVDKRRG